MVIEKDKILKLPEYKLPETSSFSLFEGCPSGPWEEFDWKGRSISKDKDLHPIVWTSENCKFLLDSSHIDDPTFSFIPEVGFGSKNTLIKTPKIVVVNTLKRFSASGIVVDLVNQIGADLLNEEGIAIVTLRGTGNDTSLSFNGLRYGLPCQSIDSYVVSFTPITVQVGHAEEEQFTGGEVLFLTMNLRYYDFIGGDPNNIFGLVDLNGLNHDLAEVTRCYERFKRVKWIHYVNPFSVPSEPFGLPRAVAAIGPTNIPFASMMNPGQEIHTTSGPDVVGKYVVLNSGSPEMIAVFANEIKSFFEL